VDEPDLTGHLCEQCLDAPAVALVPAPWGGDMGICVACGGLPPAVPAAWDAVPACTHLCPVTRSGRGRVGLCAALHGQRAPPATRCLAAPAGGEDLPVRS
jgi:hypothetical protein